MWSSNQSIRTSAEHDGKVADILAATKETLLKIFQLFTTEKHQSRCTSRM